MIPSLSQFFPWLNLQGPSSRDVNLDMGRSTSLFSPQYHFSGNHRIEQEVVEKVASYGKQLGILSEVVLALAEEKEGEQVVRLERMVKEIEEIKKRHVGNLREETKSRLEQLKKKDPEAFKQLLDEHREE